MILYLKVVQRLKFSIGIRKNKMSFLILAIVFCKSNLGKIPALNQTLDSQWDVRNILYTEWVKGSTLTALSDKVPLLTISP